MHLPTPVFLTKVVGTILVYYRYFKKTNQTFISFINTVFDIHPRLCMVIPKVLWTIFSDQIANDDSASFVSWSIEMLEQCMVLMFMIPQTDETQLCANISTRARVYVCSLYSVAKLICTFLTLLQLITVIASCLCARRKQSCCDMYLSPLQNQYNS